MSLRRLLLTAAAMAGLAAGLRVLAPSPSAVLGALAAPQQLVDTAGPSALVLAVTGGLAWLVWAWGALGLLLTAVGALPGAAGSGARLLQRVLLPESARRAAAVALGVGLALQSPLAAGAATLASVDTGSAALLTTDPVIPDWPTAPSDSAPSPKQQQSADSHLVVPGDCLWEIASDRLRAAGPRAPSAAETAGAVSAWWQQNRAVIGADPDLLLPGQVLTPPAAP